MIMESEPEEKSLYERILEKPPVYRKRLTFLLVALIGFLIVTIWIFITSYQIKKALRGEDQPAEEENVQDVTTSSPPAESEILPEELQEKNEIFKK